MSVASAIDKMFPIMLKMLADQLATLRAAGQRPLLFWSTLKTDDSEQRLAIDVCDGVLSKQQRVAKWEVCVQQRTLGRPH